MDFLPKLECSCNAARCQYCLRCSVCCDCDDDDPVKASSSSSSSFSSSSSSAAKRKRRKGLVSDNKKQHNKKDKQGDNSKKKTKKKVKESKPANNIGKSTHNGEGEDVKRRNNKSKTPGGKKSNKSSSPSPNLISVPSSSKITGATATSASTSTPSASTAAATTAPPASNASAAATAGAAAVHSATPDNRNSTTGPLRSWAFTPLSRSNATPKDVEVAFGWYEGKVTKKIPRVELRTVSNKRQDIPSGAWSATLNVLDNALRQLANILYPADPETLCAAFSSKKLGQPASTSGFFPVASTYNGSADATVSPDTVPINRTKSDAHAVVSSSMGASTTAGSSTQSQDEVGAAEINNDGNDDSGFDASQVVDELMHRQMDSTELSHIDSNAQICAIAQALELRLRQTVDKLQRRDRQVSELNTRVKDADSLLRTLLACDSRCKRTSNERRSLRAVLCGTFSQPRLSSLHIMKEVEFRMGKPAHEESVQDYARLMAGDSLVPRGRKALQQSDVEKVNAAVSFLLSPVAVGTLSYGVKEFHLDGQTEILPAFSLLQSAEKTHKAYKAWCESGSTTSTSSTTEHMSGGQNGLVPKGTFLLLIEALMSTQSVERQDAMSLVTQFLLVETFQVLVRIAESLRPNMLQDGEQDPLVTHAAHACNFLRFCYHRHVCTRESRSDVGGGGGDVSDGEAITSLHPTHDIEQAILVGTTKRDVQFDSDEPRGNASTATLSSCAACTSPFAIVEQIRARVLLESRRLLSESATNSNTDIDQDVKKEENVTRTLQVLDQCKAKLQMYMAHQLRCANQRMAIQQGIAQLEASCQTSKCDGDTAWIVLGKEPPVSVRIKSSSRPVKENRFGWLAARVIVCEFDTESDCAVQTESFYDDVIECEEQNILGLNDKLETVQAHKKLIPTPPTAYDDALLAAVLEGLLLRITTKNPSVSKAVVQLDADTSDTSARFLLSCGEMRDSTGVEVVRVVRPEPHDMSELDLREHFSASKRWVSAHVSSPIHSLSASQFARALRAFGGANKRKSSTVVSVVCLNPAKMNNLRSTYHASLVRAMAPHVASAIDVMFSGYRQCKGGNSGSETSINDATIAKKAETTADARTAAADTKTTAFNMRCFLYSHLDAGGVCDIKVDLSCDDVKIHSDGESGEGGRAKISRRRGGPVGVEPMPLCAYDLSVHTGDEATADCPVAVEILAPVSAAVASVVGDSRVGDSRVGDDDVWVELLGITTKTMPVDAIATDVVACKTTASVVVPNGSTKNGTNHVKMEGSSSSGAAVSTVATAAAVSNGTENKSNNCNKTTHITDALDNMRQLDVSGTSSSEVAGERYTQVGARHGVRVLSRAGELSLGRGGDVGSDDVPVVDVLVWRDNMDDTNTDNKETTRSMCVAYGVRRAVELSKAGLLPDSRDATVEGETYEYAKAEDPALSSSPASCSFSSSPFANARGWARRDLWVVAKGCWDWWPVDVYSVEIRVKFNEHGINRRVSPLTIWNAMCGRHPAAFDLPSTTQIGREVQRLHLRNVMRRFGRTNSNSSNTLLPADVNDNEVKRGGGKEGDTIRATEAKEDRDYDDDHHNIDNSDNTSAVPARKRKKKKKKRKDGSENDKKEKKKEEEEEKIKVASSRKRSRSNGASSESGHRKTDDEAEDAQMVAEIAGSSKQQPSKKLKKKKEKEAVDTGTAITTTTTTTTTQSEDITTANATAQVSPLATTLAHRPLVAPSSTSACLTNNVNSDATVAAEAASAMALMAAAVAGASTGASSSAASSSYPMPSTDSMSSVLSSLASSTAPITTPTTTTTASSQAALTAGQWTPQLLMQHIEQGGAVPPEMVPVVQQLLHEQRIQQQQQQQQQQIAALRHALQLGQVTPEVAMQFHAQMEFTQHQQQQQQEQQQHVMQQALAMQQAQQEQHAQQQAQQQSQVMQQQHRVQTHANAQQQQRQPHHVGGGGTSDAMLTPETYMSALVEIVQHAPNVSPHNALWILKSRLSQKAQANLPPVQQVGNDLQNIKRMLCEAMKSAVANK